jgi:hypothetical protein
LSRLGTAIYRQQALDDALGVIEPVDAEQQDPPAELPGQRRDLRAGFRVGGEPGEVFCVDGDRRGQRGHGPAVRQDHG